MVLEVHAVSSEVFLYAVGAFQTPYFALLSPTSPYFHLILWQLNHKPSNLEVGNGWHKAIVIISLTVTFDVSLLNILYLDLMISRLGQPYFFRCFSPYHHLTLKCFIEKCVNHCTTQGRFCWPTFVRSHLFNTCFKVKRVHHTWTTLYSGFNRKIVKSAVRSQIFPDA